MFKKLVKTKFPNSEEKAFNYAIRNLSMRWFGEAEMRKRMELKGFSPQVVGGVLQRLKTLGYLNDSKRLETMLSEYKDFGTYGKRYIEQKLLQKNFAREDVATAFEMYWDDEAELASAHRFLSKQKLPFGQLEQKDRQRLMAKFLRRGFGYELVTRLF